MVSVIIYEDVINPFSLSASLVRDRQELLPLKILNFFNEDMFLYDNWEGEHRVIMRNVNNNLPPVAKICINLVLNICLWVNIRNTALYCDVSILKSRDITLPTKVHLVKAMVFPVVMYGGESWTRKKAECQRTDAFELWC